MFGWFKKKNEKPDRPKVYVTSRGGWYVKIEELLASKAWDDLMNQMQRERQRRSDAGESRPPATQAGRRDQGGWHDKRLAGSTTGKPAITGERDPLEPCTR